MSLQGPTSRLFGDLVIEAAQVLKSKDEARYAPVIRWMLAKETKQARTPTKRKQIAYVGKGKRKSDKFFIESELLKGEKGESL